MQPRECLGKTTILDGIIEYNGIAESSPLNDLYCLLRMLQAIIQECNLTVLNVSYHQFQPYGVTALYLLSESHVSIHTWPESNRFALDVYSCKEGYDVDAIIALIKKELPLVEYETRECKRAI